MIYACNRKQTYIHLFGLRYLNKQNLCFLQQTIKLKTLYFLLIRWNQLDVFIVILSIAGIILEEMKSDVIPINPTIIRVMRVLRIARGKHILK